LEQITKANEEYEENFGYIFIVSDTGKSAEEMLIILQQRIHNDPHDELMIAAAEQDKITKLRLQKLFS
jgi:2-oxo-4-hydroxy-4-carboxy-5-ureidoimidazoline decarboxylase